jgi:hypothetical protein
VQATAVENEEEKKKREIKTQAAEFFVARSFEKLEEYAETS